MCSNTIICIDIKPNILSDFTLKIIEPGVLKNHFEIIINIGKYSKNMT